MKSLILRSNRVTSVLFLALSLSMALVLWVVVPLLLGVRDIIVPPNEVFHALMKTLQDGSLWLNVRVSMTRVLIGFSLGLIFSIPVAFLLSWYKWFRVIVEPWIQFTRTVPPIALIPIVIAVLGIGAEAKIAIIFFGVSNLTIITIYQGIKNVDQTLIKAAKVFDASDYQLFMNVILPASFPYILVGIRLGLAAGLTTLIAAELVGASVGIGYMVQSASMYFRMDVVLLGILVIGVIGFVLDRIVLFLERKLTSWQEVYSND